MKVALELRLLLGFAFTLACIAAVPGDVGGCGESPKPLDAPAFFTQKRRLDCDRCTACGLQTARCLRACEETEPNPERMPEGCAPLSHDGEVCLRALEAASCREYARFVADVAPVVPSECDFCPPRDGG